ncbi:hypothetical protein H4219_005352 [Mycoemilia scoparia]|uniref:Uncharacterized protein n=1 Tax=Mycoemilia scoparia TaxID=417184 RepID=A0A9W7ZWH3_9FUNG|nr:hypothetical protein H4219_005352 [Mycoemilia scoparia]
MNTTNDEDKLDSKPVDNVDAIIDSGSRGTATSPGTNTTVTTGTVSLPEPPKRKRGRPRLSDINKAPTVNNHCKIAANGAESGPDLALPKRKRGRPRKTDQKILEAQREDHPCGSCGKLQDNRHLRRIVDGLRVCSECVPSYMTRRIDRRVRAPSGNSANVFPDDLALPSPANTIESSSTTPVPRSSKVKGSDSPLTPITPAQILEKYTDSHESSNMATEYFGANELGNTTGMVSNQSSQVNTVLDDSDSSDPLSSVYDLTDFWNSDENPKECSDPIQDKQAKDQQPKETPTVQKNKSAFYTTGAFLTRRTIEKLTDGLGISNISDIQQYSTKVYQLDDRIEVLGLEKIWHPGRISLIRKARALVSYDGWPSEFNEWVDLSSRRLRPAFSQVANQNSNCNSKDDDRYSQCQPLQPTEGIMKEPGMKTTKKVITSLSPIPATGHIKRPVGRPRKNPLPIQASLSSKDSTAGSGAENIPESISSSKSKAANKRGNKRKSIPRARSKDVDQVDETKETSLEPNSKNFVTTGAFLTRRTHSVLAKEEDGLVAMYHGWRAGEFVEVLNIDKHWYAGRIITFKLGKALVYFLGWEHSLNEWVDIESPRLRKPSQPDPALEADSAATALSSLEKDGVEKSIASRLWKEYNEYLKVKAAPQTSRVVKPKKQGNVGPKKRIDPTGLNERIKSIANISGPTRGGDSGDNADNSNLVIEADPLTDEQLSEYKPLPQLLRVKDYSDLYKPRLKIALRDRSKEWWAATVIETKSFRVLIHYEGFPQSYDEWLEMNSQRIMIPKSIQEDESSDQKKEQSIDSSEDDVYVDIESVEYSEPERILTENVASTVEMEAENAWDRGIKPVHKSNSKKQHLSYVIEQATKQKKQPSAYPLSMRLAYKSVMEDVDTQLEKHPEDRGTFKLPQNTMSTKDYLIFYKINDRIRVRGIDKVWYEGTILNIKHGRLKIRCDGWPPKFDEWIAFNSDRLRVLLETIESDQRLEKYLSEERRRNRRIKEKRQAELRKERSQKLEKVVNALANSLEFITSTKTSDNIARATAENGQDSCSVVPEDGSKADQGACELHPGDSENWLIYCNQCQVVIKQFRYYCIHCEKPSDGYDYNSFELCHWCFIGNFPNDHKHPRTSFACSPVVDIEKLVEIYKIDRGSGKETYQHVSNGKEGDESDTLLAGFIQGYEPDEFDPTWNPEENQANPLRDFAKRFNKRYKIINSLNNTVANSDNQDGVSNAQSLEGNAIPMDAGQSYGILKKHHHRRRCGFCGEDDLGESNTDGSRNGSGFISEIPLLSTQVLSDGVVKHRRFWAHITCALYSPEVVMVEKTNKWYNVAAAMRRGRSLRCVKCHQKGATIGCFDPKCHRSYHISCTEKPLSHFEKGILFWCPQHESKLEEMNPYTESYTCDKCEHTFVGDEKWRTCNKCQDDYFSAFDLCNSCFDSEFIHDHPKEDFVEYKLRNEFVKSRSKGGGALHCQFCLCTKSKRWHKGCDGKLICKPCFLAACSLSSITPIGFGNSENYLTTAISSGLLPGAGILGVAGVEVEALNPFGTSIKDLAQTMSNIPNGNDGSIQSMNTLNSSDNIIESLSTLSSSLGIYVGSIEDYKNNPYFSRETFAVSQPPEKNPANVDDADALSQGTPLHQLPGLGFLESYGPTESMIFSLVVDSTYYDIPARAPRWASHSGTDYHGTWLPQTVRRAILRYTKPGERILSTFLGRGTDSIESFLLRRKCVGVDINPAAVMLAQRNSSFAVPPSLGLSEEYRAVILQGDSRRLRSIPGKTAQMYFGDECVYDHVLSHPPYKDCVAYSTYIEGDLSRFPGPDQFHKEMSYVISETWRLLRMGRYCTVGIGDNRAECFYIPLGFQLIRGYIDQGFEIDEVVIKRQRYCQAMGLGTYLCVQFDFLMFTHEFILSLRKVPKDKIDRMILSDNEYKEINGSLPPEDKDKEEMIEVKSREIRPIPQCPIDRKSVVMGSVWTFHPQGKYTLPQLCMSRMVERFGRDGASWEHVQLEVIDPEAKEVPKNPTYSEEGGVGGGFGLDINADGNEISNYELERQAKIRENQNRLLALGLVSELGEESEDVGHYKKLMNQPIISDQDDDDAPLALIVIPHIPESSIGFRHIKSYRLNLIACIHNAYKRLSPSGLLVIGVQEVRDEFGKLWPMGMLVVEDVQRAVGDINLRLKELVVCVEKGWERKKNESHTIQNFKEEECIIDAEVVKHIPIIHVSS